MGTAFFIKLGGFVMLTTIAFQKCITLGGNNGDFWRKLNKYAKKCMISAQI